MTLHAEVIVFCNDFPWLVGGKGKERAREEATFSKSAAQSSCGSFVARATPWMGGGRFRTWSSAGAGLARQLHIGGERRVMATAWPFFWPQKMMGGEDSKDELATMWATVAAAGAEATHDAQGSLPAHGAAYLHRTIRCPLAHTVTPPPTPPRASRCTWRLRHLLGELFWGLGLDFLYHVLLS